MRNARFVAAALLGTAALSGCATKGYVNRQVATASTTAATALDAERVARVGADSAQSRDVAALRTDLARLGRFPPTFGSEPRWRSAAPVFKT